MNEKLEMEKKMIRSILLPFKNGCLLPEFLREYRTTIGQNVPSTAFGFPDVTSFLASMPDVVRLRRSPPTNEVHLTVVADDSTRHIQKMVEKQKPQKRKPVPRKPVHYPSRSIYYKGIGPTPSWSVVQPQRTWVKNPHPNLPPRLRPDKNLPRTLKVRVVDMVRKSRNGQVTLTDFLPSFEAMYGESFVFKNFGFSTLQDCLETIPELTMWTRSNEIYVQYAGEPTKEPLYTEPEPQNDTIKPMEVKTPEIPPSKMERMFPVNKLSNHRSPDSIAPASNQMSYTILNEGTGDRKSLHESPAFTKPKDLIQLPVENNVSMNGEDGRSTLGASNSKEPEDIPPFVLKNLEKIASMYPQGIWATDFPSLYEDVIKTEFDLHSLGYNDLSLFIDAVPHIFKREVIKDMKNTYVISPANAPKGTNPSWSMAMVDTIISNVRGILQAYPEGIKLEEFLHIYSINCSEPLNIQAFGFENVEGFLTNLASRVPLKISLSLAGKLVHYLQASVERTFQFAPSPEIVPFDAVVPPTRIETARPPKDAAHPSKYFPVYTSTIESPSLLYIQINQPEYLEAMHRLYDKMEDFYHSPEAEQYRMRNAHIKVGTVCVALWPHDQHWYRVRVISIPSLESVQVFYFDYGTKEEISTSMLRYMRKEYAGLPAQALVASLACLIPPHKASRWDPRARARMLRLCRDVTLMASVSGVSEDGKLLLLLCDTNGERDTYINDILLNEGLADCEQAASTQEEFQALQAQMVMQAYASGTGPADLARMFQGLSMSLPRPQQFSGPIPPPVFASDPYRMESKTPSPTESEVFGEEDDKLFDQFYNKVITVMKRYVKRVTSSDGYTFHILIVDSQPYVSCGDVTHVIWHDHECEYLLQRLQNREVQLPSRTIHEKDHEDLFYQAERFFVRGIEKVGNTPQMLIYSLESLVAIMNLFGQPSVDLRNRIKSELESFDTCDPHWQELSAAEFPELEEQSVATDDDKLNRLCLYDLFAMRESIRLRRSERMRELMSFPTSTVDDVGKMEHLLEKVEERIEVIKKICDNFT